MSLTYSAPSKTFLVGEYAALQGGATLILNTSPRFSMHLRPQLQDHVSSTAGTSIHPESPAGQWIQAHPEHFFSYQLTFNNPHPQGGLGASSAEFLLAWRHVYRHETTINTTQLRRDYLTYATPTTGIAPSGADVLAQALGLVTLYHRNTQTLQSFEWPFPNLAYCLLSTPTQITTHQHLANLPTTINFKALDQFAQSTVTAWIHRNEECFIRGINNYYQVLLEQQCVIASTQHNVEILKKEPYILAIKGCGALAADVLLVLVNTNKLTTLIQYAQEGGFPVIDYGCHAEHGLNC